MVYFGFLRGTLKGENGGECDMYANVHNLCLVVFLLLGAFSNQQQPPPRPNILFIAVDDLRPELNCYGRTHIKSPNIDRLAQEGTIFQGEMVPFMIDSPVPGEV